MPRLLRSDILIALAVAAILVVAALAGLTRILGAHPWWAHQTGIIGGIGGAVVWLLLRRVGLAVKWQLVLGLIALLMSAAAAHFGKQVFAASYAENALAGRFWYFGWFALSGSAALCLASLLGLLARR